MGYPEEIFESLHAIAEEGFKEHRTTAFIAEELEKLGYTPVVGLCPEGTGVFCVLEGAEPQGATLLVRADMDGLVFDVEGKSKVIHACGHDANSTVVLSTVKLLKEKGLIPERGKVVFLFQPAEEKGVGAEKVIDSGKLPPIDEVVSCHLRPAAEASLGEATPALCHGSACHVKVVVHGEAAHGARPHLGVNAIDAALLVIEAVKAIAIDPRVSHSVKVTRFHTGGSADNVIPDYAEMIFDLRAQTNEAMESCIEGVIMASKAAASLGASAQTEVLHRTFAARYDQEMVDTAAEAIREVLGKALPPIVTPGAEDLHAFTERLKTKTTYIGLGANLVPGLHKINMTFDKAVLPLGRDIMVKFIEKRLGLVKNS